MEIAIFENFVDLSFIAALFFAAQAEKKLDIFGKIIKRNTSDRIKVAFIGLIHAVIWILFFHPEGLSLKDHIKIIFTSYMAMVVVYDYLLKKFIKKQEEL
jgi:hypothetical protein